MSIIICSDRILHRENKELTVGVTPKHSLQGGKHINFIQNQVILGLYNSYKQQKNNFLPLQESPSNNSLPINSSRTHAEATMAQQKQLRQSWVHSTILIFCFIISCRLSNLSWPQKGTASRKCKNVQYFPHTVIAC